MIGVNRTYMSSNIAKGVWSNTQNYSNARVDELLDMAAQENDPEKRKALYAEFQEIVNAEVPIYFLMRCRCTRSTPIRWATRPSVASGRPLWSDTESPSLRQKTDFWIGYCAEHPAPKDREGRCRRRRPLCFAVMEALRTKGREYL